MRRNLDICLGCEHLILRDASDRCDNFRGRMLCVDNPSHGSQRYFSCELYYESPIRLEGSLLAKDQKARHKFEAREVKTRCPRIVEQQLHEWNVK